MEAAGVEPASESTPSQESTCVAALESSRLTSKSDGNRQALVPESLVEWEQLYAFYSGFTFRTKTIGPVAPKINFVAIDFLNYLIPLVHESYNLGWIKNSGVQQSLLAKLTSAKRQLEKPDNPSAKNLIGAFLNELNGIKCEDFSCPGNESLTSEAYGLLFFNGQYLYDRL